MGGGGYFVSGAKMLFKYFGPFERIKLYFLLCRAIFVIDGGWVCSGCLIYYLFLLFGLFVHCWANCQKNDFSISFGQFVVLLIWPNWVIFEQIAIFLPEWLKMGQGSKLRSWSSFLAFLKVW